MFHSDIPKITPWLSMLPLKPNTHVQASNAQDLWIGARVAREGRTFPSDRLKVTE
jgi:hypothetical protein